jgi:SOS response regulatory protein OraA/RecX
VKDRKDEFPAAWRRAVRALARRPVTRRELASLLGKRFGADMVKRVLDDLERQSLLSDPAAAEAIAHARARTGAATGQIEQRLLDRGVAPELARRAAKKATAHRSDEAEAFRLARERVRAAPARLSPDALRRRVFAWLARRGYDELTCQDAVERAVERVVHE